ncbi:MAG: S8 family serine peptidase [Nannocystaceae bacterium]
MRAPSPRPRLPAPRPCSSAVAALLTAAALTGCGDPDHHEPEASVAPIQALADETPEARAARHIERELELAAQTDYDEIITVTDGIWTTARVVHEPSRLLTYGRVHEDAPGPEHPEAPPPAPVIHPAVEAAIASAGPDGEIEVLLALRKRSHLPRLPGLIPEEPRESEANQIVLRRREAMLEEGARRRARERAPTLEAVRARGGVVLEEFTFGNAALARVPASAARELASLPDVVHIEPTLDAPPPDVPTAPDNQNDNDVDDGRARINSDTYFNNGYDALGAGQYLGLMDTGVRSTHTLFSPVDFIAFERDCVNGGVNCNNSADPDYNTDDDCWNHGTATAAIISGNNDFGDTYRGVSQVSIDSWKVYPNDCVGLSTTAVLRAYARGVAVGDSVMVAEMQSTQAETGSIASAADDAFDTGTMTVAANGNAGPSASTVTSPANAHKALGVGAIDVQSGNTVNAQSRGPTADLRHKPDFQAPTFTETASTACDTCLQTHGNTSGATPYGAAAAMMLRDQFATNGFGTEPGKIYAALVNFGDRTTAMSDTFGAGALELGNLFCRRRLQGSRTLTNGASTDITFATVADQRDLQVSIFWPEEPGTHNEIELRIYDAAGVLRASSLSNVDVKQKVRVNGPLTPAGVWRAELHGDVVSGSQTVYYHLYHEVSPYACD